MDALSIACGVWAVLIIAGLIWLGYQIKKAPEGFEDARGFHLGRRRK